MENDKLKELQEAAKEHCITLQPATRGYRKGNYHKHVFLKDYQHLGSTVEAILNTCIIALDGFEFLDSEKDIREVHKQFADVLEFAKALLPHEELEFLDKSRRILFPKDGSNL